MVLKVLIDFTYFFMQDLLYETNYLLHETQKQNRIVTFGIYHVSDNKENWKNVLKKT